MVYGDSGKINSLKVEKLLDGRLNIMYNKNKYTNYTELRSGYKK